MSFPAELNSFALFHLLLSYFQGHGTWRSTAIMARICVKRALFCITGVSRQIARTGADGEIHIQHIAREKEQRRKIPPRIRQRLGEFFRFDGFLTAAGST